MLKNLTSKPSSAGISAGAIYIFVAIFAVVLHRTDGQCFPTDFLNSTWTSTNFGTMTFTSSTVSVTEAQEYGENPQAYLLSWDCIESSSTIFIMRSTSGFNALNSIPAHAFYCILFTKQNIDSYYYEANTVELADPNNVTLDDTHCQSSNDVSSLNVMLKDAAAGRQTCAEPILGSFTHSIDASAVSIGCSNGTWDSACDTDKSALNITYETTACNPIVYAGYSSEGILYCALATQSFNIYYQILYNPGATTGTETRLFSCLTITITNTSSDGTTTVSIEQRTCDDRASASPIVITLMSASLCPVIVTTTAATTTVATQDTNNTATIVGAVVGALLFLILLGLLALIIWYCKRDRYGQPIVENTKPRFEDPDLDETIEDLEMDNTSSPVTRDDITIDPLSPTNIMARRAVELPNGSILNKPAVMKEDHLNRSLNGSIPNGYFGKEIGNHFSEKPGDRPAPRVHKLTPGKETMVIFNGDEKVISGNDSRVVANDNPTSRSMIMDQGGALTFKSLDEEGNWDDYQGNVDDLPYPSIPRAKSNLMPPIETIDSPKVKN